MTKPFLISGSTFLRRCTKRPSVETKATENPVRLCVLCFLGLCADVGAVSGLSASKSDSTWPNMACSRPRLDWSPLREATEEPSSSEPWETHFLPLLVWLPIQSVQHIKEEQQTWSNLQTEYFILEKIHPLQILPDLLWGGSELRTWETRTDVSSLASSDWLCLDRTRWTATVALRAEMTLDKCLFSRLMPDCNKWFLDHYLK